MKSVLFACLVASLCLGSATAQDLGNSREPPVKNTPVVTYEPPAVPRQGGDTVDDAFPITSLPFYDTGTTVGHINDYDDHSTRGHNDTRVLSPGEEPRKPEQCSTEDEQHSAMYQSADHG